MYTTDFFNGFSDPSDCEHLSGEEEGCEESLDLLSSMLEETTNRQQQHKDPKVNQRKHPGPVID